MPGKLRPRLSYGNVVSTLCLFILLGGGAYAATSFVGSDGQIRACVSKNGQLTVLMPGKKCGKGKIGIAWNQRGRRGLKGDTGPSTGPAGGDLRGNYPSPTIAPGAVTPDKVAPPAPPTAVTDAPGTAGNCPSTTGQFCEFAELGAPLGWQNFGGVHERATFSRDTQGIVHLGGVVRVTPGANFGVICGSGDSFATIFVLPVGFRPALQPIFSVMTTNDTAGRLDVQADGQVICRSGNTSTGSGAYLSLSGISFRAAT